MFKSAGANPYELGGTSKALGENSMFWALGGVSTQRPNPPPSLAPCPKGCPPGGPRGAGGLRGGHGCPTARGTAPRIQEPRQPHEGRRCRRGTALGLEGLQRPGVSQCRRGTGVGSTPRGPRGWPETAPRGCRVSEVLRGVGALCGGCGRCPSGRAYPWRCGRGRSAHEVGPRRALGVWGV